ncbi:unnamed protein product [Bursaphelenchus okinawaensis]|uniref:Transcription factor TFIIIC triple barrel domain-containing protein n=1 Tax=Bursaphelenchus okinawaensis TaxID=465554 RepID=A0A811JTU1_9BILA|nr:unnamed protein product [Bursaphelenchus okinawaensis]CAG9082906.1 unnamed protein product [Bursaphelenchus okinawaensis]
MPKKATQEQKPQTSQAPDDEYEETIVVADLNGVLDVDSVNRAFRNGNISLRFANTDRPLVQVGQSVFAGEWNETMGTDIIFQKNGKDQDNNYEFLAKSSTRLSTNKAIVSCSNESKE